MIGCGNNRGLVFDSGVKYNSQKSRGGFPPLLFCFLNEIMML